MVTNYFELHELDIDANNCEFEWSRMYLNFTNTSSLYDALTDNRFAFQFVKFEIIREN
jgi:hypothetical protein